tara:strand:- start:23951 stop:24445 length:495 start_codon:yes stop_codon:yes gene_type:complete
MTIFALVGLIFFFTQLANEQFLGAIICLSAAVLFINIYGFVSAALKINVLGYLISVYLGVVSVSVVAIFGFEPTAIGYKTLYSVNLEAIACSIFLLLISTTILVAVQNVKAPNKSSGLDTHRPPLQINFVEKQKPDKPQKTLYDSKKWEEISSQEVESGDYQAV